MFLQTPGGRSTADVLERHVTKRILTKHETSEMEHVMFLYSLGKKKLFTMTKKVSQRQGFQSPML